MQFLAHLEIKLHLRPHTISSALEEAHTVFPSWRNQIPLITPSFHWPTILILKIPQGIIYTWRSQVSIPIWTNFTFSKNSLTRQRKKNPIIIHSYTILPTTFYFTFNSINFALKFVLSSFFFKAFFILNLKQHKMCIIKQTDTQVLIINVYPPTLHRY